MRSSVTLSTITLLYDHHHHHTQNTASSQAETLSPFNNSSPSPPPPLLPSPPPAPPVHHSACCAMILDALGISCDWNHTVLVFLRLVYFTYHEVFKVHLCGKSHIPIFRRQNRGSELKNRVLKIILLMPEVKSVHIRCQSSGSHRSSTLPYSAGATPDPPRCPFSGTLDSPMRC